MEESDWEASGMELSELRAVRLEQLGFSQDVVDLV